MNIKFAAEYVKKKISQGQVDIEDDWLSYDYSELEINVYSPDIIMGVTPEPGPDVEGIHAIAYPVKNGETLWDDGVRLQL